MTINMNILPAGSVPPVASLPEGENLLAIIQVDLGEPRIYYRISFPDGFTKTFQVTGIEELSAQISNQLRGRYGISVIEYVSIPETLEVGAIITININ